MSNPIEGSTVLVTGGAGLVGSHIVDQLIDEGAGEIRVLDNLARGRLANLERAMSQREVKFLEGDIRNAATVRSAMAGCDYAFHQAAIRITRCAEAPRECMDVLVSGTFNVFEAAVREKVRKVVYASSASVYGAADRFPTGEMHHPYNNRTLYGAAKVMNEGIAHCFHEMYRLPSVGLRYFNVYGPRMDTTGAYTEVFVRWLDCAARGIRPQIHGDGSSTMDLVYVRDVARANIMSLKSDRSNAVFNVASGTETSLLMLWHAIQSVTSAYELQPEFLPPRNVNPVPRRLADIRRARDEIGFVAETSLITGLRELTTWWAAQQSTNTISA